MSKWKTKKVVQVYDGMSFDSNTEIEFYKRYKEYYYRNEKTFIIWSSAWTDESIDYTPDFIHRTKNIWVETKGYKDPLYSLREKLIRDYCKRNGITYYLLKWDNSINDFSTEDTIKKGQQDYIKECQDTLKRLWYLWEERKSLSDDEYKEISHTLLNDTKLPNLRKGNMVNKKKYFMEIKAKIKGVKEPWAKLKQIHIDMKLSKQS